MTYLFWIITSIIIASLLKIPPLAGAALGIFLAIKYGKPRFSREDYWKQAQERLQPPASFHHHCFSFMGFIAKADGHISKEEVSIAQKIMDELCLNFTQKTLAKAAFKTGGQQHNLTNTITYLKILKLQRPDLVNDFFTYQNMIIHADNSHSSNQINILNQVKYHVFSGQQQHSYQQSHNPFTTNHSALRQARQELGLNANMNYTEMKKHYRKLVGKHHPDRQQSDTAKKTAEEKLKHYQKSWNIIHKHHLKTETT